MMSGIRGKDTKPELQIRSGLHRQGFRYGLHRRDLPGKPDLVFASRKAVVFVNGCFWHGHQCHLFKWPSTRQQWWRDKINGTIQRDQKANRALQDSGWRVITVWECALKGKTRLSYEQVISELASWLSEGPDQHQIRGEMIGKPRRKK